MGEKDRGDNGSGQGWVFVGVVVAIVFIVAVFGGCVHTMMKRRRNARRGDLERGAGRGHPMQKMARPAQSTRRASPSAPRQPAPAHAMRPHGKTTNIVDLIPKAPSSGASRHTPQPFKAAVVSKPSAANPMQLPDKVLNMPAGVSRQAWQKVPPMQDYSTKAGKALPKPPQMAKTNGLKLKTNPSGPYNGPVSPMNAKDWSYSRHSLVSPITQSGSRRGR